MAVLFLVVIYLAFISLGLPDSLLGAAWPAMQPEFGAPLETAGLLFMAIAGGTILSSLASGAILKRFGTGKVALVSCLMTAGALLGFYVSPSLVWLVLFAIPLGLGAGSIDAGLNHYVAANYKAHHMSWLHCFWGVGATLGPIILAAFIAGDHSWRNGYLAIAGIQFAIVVLLFVSLPLWKKNEKDNGALEKEGGASPAVQPIKPMRIKGVKFALITFLFYCGVESTMGLWGSSFLVNVKGLSIETAARWVSFYFAGITAGRFVTGFVTLRASNRTLIRSGQLIALTGAILLVLPLPIMLSLVGFVLVGLGLAPIFPCMLHETPAHFGKEHAQTIMGYQMAVAYTGSTFIPPLLGFMAAQSTIGIFPFFITALIAVMLLGTERLNALMKNRNRLGKEKADSPMI
ncbi:MFS transporter [Planococcus sp. YIM B11945]|uniref:MFS transporter n=1 Tax=Planococcus sp. YIM B11945 TaxID=3435410 RepID=UPI003D7EA381